MRYSKTEITTLVGNFKPNSIVTIKLIDSNTDTLVNLTSSTCTESRHIPGVYLWKTDKISDSNLKNVFHNLVYEMSSNDGKKFYGKFIYSGYVDKNVVVDFDDIKVNLNDLQDGIDLINGRI